MKNKEIANKLEDLVLDGIEEVTTSFYDLYNVDNEPIQKKIFVLQFKGVDKKLEDIEGD